MYTILLLLLCFTCFCSEKSPDNKSPEKTQLVRSPSSPSLKESDLKKKHEKLRPNPLPIKPSHKRKHRIIPIWQMGPEDLFPVSEDPVLSSEEDDGWSSPSPTFQSEK